MTQAGEVGRQVVARVVEARLHELQAVAPVAHEVVRVLLLLLDGEVAEGERDAAGSPPLDVGDVLVGHAEEAEDDERRQLVGQRRHEVERAGVVDLVEHARGDLEDLRLEHGDAPRREGLLDEAAQAGVVRGLARAQPGVGGELAVVEDRLDLRRARLVGRLGVLRRERRRVLEDRADVVVARDDPEAELLAEEDRLLPSSALEEAERILEVERLEVRCHVVHRAAPRGGSRRRCRAGSLHHGPTVRGGDRAINSELTIL